MKGSTSKLATWLAVGLFAVLYLGLCVWAKQIALSSDYLQNYIGAKAWLTGEAQRVYDRDFQRELSTLYGSEGSVTCCFFRPGYALPLLSVTAWGGLEWGWTLNTGLQAVLLLALGWWLGRELGEAALLLTAGFYPAWMGIAVGQDLVFGLVALTVAFALEKRGKSRWAGVALAFPLWKFHLFLLVPLVLLLQGRRRVLQGFVLMALGEALASVLLVGVGGVQSYVALLRSGGMLPTGDVRMPNIHDLLLSFGVENLLLQAALTGVAVGLALWTARRESLEVGVSMGVLAMILAVPHCFVYDLTFLLPGLLVLASGRGGERWVAFALLIPIPYLLHLALPLPGPALLPFLLLALLGGRALGWTTWRERGYAAEAG